MKKFQKLAMGLIIAVVAFTGVAALSPANSSPFAAQAAHACNPYYRIVWSSVGVRAWPGGPVEVNAYYGNPVYMMSGGTSGGWTHVEYITSNYYGYDGYIPEASRVWAGCL